MSVCQDEYESAERREACIENYLDVHYSFGVLKIRFAQQSLQLLRNFRQHFLFSTLLLNCSKPLTKRINLLLGETTCDSQALSV